MSPRFELDGDAFAATFPFGILADREGRILRVGSALGRLIEAAEGRDLFEVVPAIIAALGE